MCYNYSVVYMNNTFIKYIVIAISSFIIDIVLFKVFNTIFFNLTYKIIIATILARIISSLFNYLMNKDKVFGSNKNLKDTIIKYYCLVILAMLTSAFTVNFLSNLFKNIDPVIIKIPVEFLIFIGNYLIQKNFIFKNQ